MSDHENNSFWDAFNQENFDSALSCFEMFSAQQKKDIFSVLFQKSGHQQTPHSISVLFRELKDNNDFSDFHAAWLPAPEHLNTKEHSGQVFQQFFPAPIRVINGINMNNPNEIVSVGLHWLSEQEVKSMMDFVQDQKNSNRGEAIVDVATQTKEGLFMVKTDENLGTPFKTLG